MSGKITFFDMLARRAERFNAQAARGGEPLPLAQLEQDGAELARFLGVNLEGL